MGCQLAGVLANEYQLEAFLYEDSSSFHLPGIVCILENSYNQTLAYRIDGPDVTYLGDEDLHDTDMIPWNFADINAHVPTKQDPEPDPTRRYR
jgi:hypothetical protein